MWRAGWRVPEAAPLCGQPVFSPSLGLVNGAKLSGWAVGAGALAKSQSRRRLTQHQPDPAVAALRLGEDRPKIALLARFWVITTGQVMQIVGPLYMEN